jgi:hypothetical protein
MAALAYSVNASAKMGRKKSDVSTTKGVLASDKLVALEVKSASFHRSEDMPDDLAAELEASLRK